MNQRRRLVFAALAILVVFVLGLTVTMKAYSPVTGSIGGVLHGPCVPPPDSAHVDYTIRSGDNIAAILQRFGVPSGAVLEAAAAHYDLSRIRSGRTLRIEYRRGLAHASGLRYPIDEDTTLVVGFEAPVGWNARLELVQYEQRQVERQFVVQSSLWNAAMDAGLRPNDVVRLAEIFQWDIDFNTELKKGDTFTMVAEGLFMEGELRKLGAIHAVALHSGQSDLIAIRHEGVEGEGYFDPDGKARRKPFLRSPLAFSRVSSGFNARGRLHPVTGKRRPHYGTDFAAPTGTPIRSVGNGVVTAAHNAGGYGLLVRIRHDGGYESGYAHMSKILVRKGQRVKQGQTIGKVGSTGLSTGPHCHYELQLNGRYVNPLTAKLPVSVPLPKSEQAAFAVERDRWLPVLRQAMDAQSVPGDDLGQRGEPGGAGELGG
jgi:murein DD-endopeptidase MepM/ murein hydrolase activator NlpD